MKKWNATITHHSHDSCAVAQLTPGRECHGEQVKTYTYTQGWSTGTPKDVSSFFKNGTGGRVRGVARGLGSPSRAACVKVKVLVLTHGGAQAKSARSRTRALRART
jgi:hypothetical protein